MERVLCGAKKSVRSLGNAAGVAHHTVKGKREAEGRKEQPSLLETMGTFFSVFAAGTPKPAAG